MPFRGDPSVLDEATLIPNLLNDDERAWRTFHELYSSRLQGAISRVTRRFPQLTGPTTSTRSMVRSACVC